MATAQELYQFAQMIKTWGNEFGFQHVSISDIHLSDYEPLLKQWIEKHYHGEMVWMTKHGNKRLHPQELHSGTLRVISARMDYLPANAQFATALKNSQSGYISRYALGRDYHKVLRSRLKMLAEQIKQHCPTLDYRPFVDSAPVLEHAYAEKSGIGWQGKNSLIIHPQAGSWFFLGELFINIPLPTDSITVDNQCGRCNACMTICPTQAIVAPYVVDAKRCISYLTIEYKGIIPEAFRPLIGNRIYGCDDCQLICPWNRFAKLTTEPDFRPRPVLLVADLLTLYQWDETTFLKQTEGSAIRRIGYLQWLRNITIALGNAPSSKRIIDVLKNRLNQHPLLDEHIHWSINQQCLKERPLNKRLQQLIRSIEKGLPRDA